MVELDTNVRCIATCQNYNVLTGSWHVMALVVHNVADCVPHLYIILFDNELYYSSYRAFYELKFELTPVP